MSEPMIRLTRAQVRQVDRIAVEKYHVPGIVLMENAALFATDVACAILVNDPRSRFLIVCGAGNNGGDGLAIARHLHNRKMEVTVGLLADPSKYKADALINWNIVSAMRLPVLDSNATLKAIKKAKCDMLVDAVFGTGLTSPPRPPFDAYVDAVGSSDVKVLAVDVPSGLDCDTGFPIGPACVRATDTVTFVAEKTGFANPVSKAYTGDLFIGDIGCPREIIDEVLRTFPSA